MFFPHFSRPIIVTVTTLSHAIRLSDRNIESNKKKWIKKFQKHANQTFNYHDCGKFNADHLLGGKKAKKQSVNQQKEMLAKLC